MASFPAAAPAVSPNGTTGSMGGPRAGQPRHLSRMEILQRHRFLPPRPSKRRSERREGQVRVSGHISPSVPRMIVCCPAARAQRGGRAVGHESGKCRSYSNPEFPFQLPAAASFVILNCGADSSDSPSLSSWKVAVAASVSLAPKQRGFGFGLIIPLCPR